MENSLLAIYIGGLILSLVILYFIISSASRSALISKELQTQNKLLKLMALNQGCDATEVEECFGPIYQENQLPDRKKMLEDFDKAEAERKSPKQHAGYDD